MNEQLQTALAEILSRATQGIDAGTQFLSAQLPDVIQQLLIWKLAYHLIPMLVAAVALMALLFAGWRLYLTAIADPRIAAGTEADAHREEWLRAPTLSDEGVAAREAMKAAKSRAMSLPNKSPVYIGLGVAIGLAGLIAAIVTLLSLNLKWLQILIAPKIYLIEYAASLAK